MQLESAKLYDWDFAPNCRRVRMFLIEKDLEIERVECITPKIALNQAFQKRYTHYMVPMLELADGTQIGEALAIWTYLEALFPQPPLMGATPLEKARISAWERRAYDEGIVGHAEIFRNSHPNFVDRGLPGYHEKIAQIPALIERGKKRVAHFYRKFNEQLADNAFVAGDKFSVADMTTLVAVDFGKALDMPIPQSAPNVERWYDAMQKRPSVRDSVPKHGPDGTPLEMAA
jgi:glutathione S-transferase